MGTKHWLSWIPGILNDAQLIRLCRERYISGGPAPETAVDRSSIDVHLSGECYRMRQGAVKPAGEDYIHYITGNGFAERYRPGPDGVFHLLPGTTYLFVLQERLKQGDFSGIYGQATAKSSVGRVDVLARLIADGMDRYEGFTPAGLQSGNGRLYLEVSPITFPVLVKAGTSLSQLRLFYGSPEQSRVEGSELYRSLLSTNGSTADSLDGTLSANLANIESGGKLVCAYRAVSGNNRLPPVRLWSDASPPAEAARYWEGIPSTADKRLIIKQNAFYIIRSRERLVIPANVAVYCRASDETIGELRVHYAGFVHPGFGTVRNDGKTGTPLIFEVRGHNVKVNLGHGEKLARLEFYRMSAECRTEPPAGTAKTDSPGRSYGNQELSLSKFFK